MGKKIGLVHHLFIFFHCLHIHTEFANYWDVWGLMSLPSLFCWGWELQSWEHVFNTPVLLSILHHTSLITKERGWRKWCHKDVMESVYKIVLGLSIPVSHELPELLCQWHVTPPWAGFDLLIVQHLMLLLHFYWPSTFIFRNLFLFLGLSM